MVSVWQAPGLGPAAFLHQVQWMFIMGEEGLELRAVGLTCGQGALLPVSSGLEAEAAALF